MLKSLHIENYALIRQSDITFNDGFVAITGETGAGKSILLGALSLLLGQRADTKVLQDPEHKCVVEALFNISEMNLKSLFDDNDVDYNDDGITIIRREVLPSSKSRAFVNDTPVQLSFLKQLGAYIIDIHSQHATLLLSNNGFQISLLDCIGDTRDLLRDYKQYYNEYSKLKQHLEKLTAQDKQNRRDYDYNKFLFDELSAANLYDGEQDELEQESTLLSNSENIKQNLSQVMELCDGEQDSVLQRLNLCKSLLAKIANYHKDINNMHSRVESTVIELRDIVSSVESLNDEINYSAERQAIVDERLDLIYRLQKKHGVNSIASLLEIQDSIAKKLSSVDSIDIEIHQVMEAVDKAYVAMQKQANKLSKARSSAATELERLIQPLLKDLSMPNAVLKADVKQTDHYGPDGNDNVTLLFNANKGGIPHELKTVASGGEMSRLMLAIKSLTAKALLLPTIIFDEIDSGISGDVSVKVGRIMQLMSQSMQVITITHLPQIAARASQHYKVFKDDDGQQTASNIKMLNPEERKHEIAVMLSSEPPTAAALQTAAELMAD